MIFEYRVVGADGVEQNGKIEANSQQDAKDKLNAMGLSVIQVEEFHGAEVEEVKSNLKKFLFSGRDAEKQDVEGEIEAVSDLDAFKRLIEEFGLDLFWLVDASTAKVVQDAQKKDSIQRLNDLAYERGVSIKKQKIQQNQNDDQINDAFVGDSEFYKKQQAFLYSIGRIGKIFEILLPVISEKSPALSIELEKKFHDLEKVKMSNNLVYIEEFIDEILSQVLYFLDKRTEIKAQYRKEILELQSLLSHGTKAKAEKFVVELSEKIKNSFSNIRSLFVVQKQVVADEDNYQTQLKKLLSEKREILRLLFLHAWGVVIKTGELRARHIDAFKKLLSQYRKLGGSIQKIKEMTENMKYFYAKDFSSLIDEIHNFSLWLFLFYAFFYIVAEISLLKSKLLPADLVWKMLHSQIILAMTFGLFLVLLLSSRIKQYYKKRFPLILLSYFAIVFIGIIFYYNY